MTPIQASAKPSVSNNLSVLGDRLIRFGQALKEPETTVGQLTALANSCGIALKLRAVAETNESDASV